MSTHVVLRTFPDRLHAELARTFLESEGIETFVSSPTNMPGSYMIAEWGDGLIPHELKVSDIELAEAESLLAGTEVDVDDSAWTAEEIGGDSDSGTSEEAEPASTAPLATPDGVCSACHGALDRDDQRFSQLRWGIGALAFIYIFGDGLLLLVSEVPSILLAAIHMPLFLVLLALRGYFVRCTCGRCGRRRVGARPV